MGTGKRDPHKKVRKDVSDVEAIIDKVPMLSVAYMYLYEKAEKPTLLVADHDSGRAWTYALRDKAILLCDGWVQRRIVDNAGHKDVKIKFKSDQEPSIVALPINSRQQTGGGIGEQRPP